MVSTLRTDDNVMMKYETHKEFLPVESFKHIQDVITEEDFPWRRRDTMADDKDEHMYFTYCFYNSMNPVSELYQPLIIPILNQLNAIAAIQVRTNMFISALFNQSHWHSDYLFKGHIGGNSKTAILYLNDCDGGTELKINDTVTFIKAEANKILIFDTPILHRAITSKEEPIRYILNFNYFTE